LRFNFSKLNKGKMQLFVDFSRFCVTISISCYSAILGGEKMYIVDFFKNLFKKNNIGIIIWMILNISLICFIFVAVSEAYLAEDIALSILTALGVYLVSIIIALSPIGEAILRWQNGCHKVSDPNILARIQPLFDGNGWCADTIY
jgi:heat shock protein HtpX